MWGSSTFLLLLVTHDYNGLHCRKLRQYGLKGFEESKVHEYDLGAFMNDTRSRINRMRTLSSAWLMIKDICSALSRGLIVCRIAPPPEMA